MCVCKRERARERGGEEEVGREGEFRAENIEKGGNEKKIKKRERRI